MKKYFLVLTFIMLSMVNVVSAQRFTIVGKVTDSITLSPLSFVNTVVFPKNDFDKPLGGTISDTLGVFKIKGIKKQNLSLKVSFVGYKTLTLEVQATDIKSDTLFLDDIKISPTGSNIGEVNIEAKIERFEIDADKMTMNIDKDLATTVNNAFELLKKVPGVFIDKDENITLNGRGGILFQFNGRDRKIQWKALTSMLKGMTPDQIEQFEVMTNPSAKYDSEGTSGIINIKFKNDKNYGFNGSVNARSSYEYDFNNTGSVNLNYVDNKWTSSINYSNNKYKSKGKSSSKTFTSINPGDTILFRSESDYAWVYNSHNLDLSVDYLIDTNNSLGMSFSYNKNYSPFMSRRYPTYISSYPNYFSEIDSSFVNTNGSESNSEDYYFSLNYTHSFDTNGTKLTSDFNTSINNSNSNNDNATRYYIGSDESNMSRQEAFRQNTVSKNRNFTFKTDIVKPFDKKTRLEFGIKSTLSLADNDFNSMILDTNSQYTNNTAKSNQFQYMENINSAYASFSKTFKEKTTLRLGLRTEQTNTKGYQVILDSTNRNSYINLFPNISLSYAFKPDNRLSFYYGYRISRPSYSSLNPFLEKSNDYSYSKGNPLLEPQFSHSVGLSYSLKYMFFPRLSYSYTKNSVSNIRERIPNTLVQISTPYNLRNTHSLNLGMSFNKEFYKWWSVYAYGSGNYSKTTSENDKIGINVESLSFSFYGGTSFTLPKKYNINFFYYYSSGGMYGLYKSSGWQGGDISVSKSFFDDKLDLSIGMGNIFTKKSNDSEYAYNGSITKSSWTGTRYSYSFSITYNFGKVYEGKKLEKVKSENSDSRVGGGSPGKGGGKP